eukprot:4755268-Amphidinium_carterae.1
MVANCSHLASSLLTCFFAPKRLPFANMISLRLSVQHKASLLPAADDGSHRRRRKSTWATATGGSANMLPD